MLDSIPAAPAAAILEGWNSTLAQSSARPAVLGADGAIVRRFGEIEEEARACRDRWADLRPGDVVAVQIGNSPSWPAVFLALLRADCITLPLPSGGAPPAWANGIVDSDLQGRRSLASPLAGVEPGTVLLKLTSGTTGEPRAIRFTADQLAADCFQICATMGITTADLNFGVIPLAHSYGFSNLVTPLLLRGVPMVVSDDRFPRAILEAIERTQATVFPGAPIIFQHLAELEASRPASLRLCISAGAPLTTAVWERFQARFGLGLHVFYGSSECGGIAYDRAGLLAEDGFVGQPMQGVTIRPLGPDGPDVPDLIEVCSPAVSDGYVPAGPDDGATLGGGRFVPGDLVRMTSSGLVLAGRASEFINIGGRKLNPLEVERRLAELPGMKEVVVFGVPSTQRGEEPIACVVGQGLDVGGILRSCSQVLPAWQVPRDVWIVPQLPVSDRGKISRRALAERYLAQRAANR